MRAISIQVQPNRSSGMDMNGVTIGFEEIAAMTDLVEHHSFDSGVDNGPYFNFTFGTSHARRLWSVIKERVYADPEIRGSHAQSLDGDVLERDWLGLVRPAVPLRFHRPR